MRFWRWRSARDGGDAPPSPQDARDERLSTYLDGELSTWGEFTTAVGKVLEAR